MQELNTPIKIDLSEINDVHVVYAMQNDMNSRKLIVSLTSNNGDDYIIEDGVVARLMGSRPDGKPIYDDCTIINNTITCVLSNYVLGAYGDANCVIGLYDDSKYIDKDNHGQLLSSIPFTIKIEKNPFDENALIVTPEFSALTNAMTIINEVVNRGNQLNEELTVLQDDLIVLKAETATARNETIDATEKAKTATSAMNALNGTVTAAEATRVSNENARKNAETARATAETARISAETGRASAEGNRVTTETSRSTAETNRQATEASRVNAENNRVTAENTRSSNENIRKSNENARISAENLRQTNTAIAIENTENLASSIRSKLEMGVFNGAEGQQGPQGIQGEKGTKGDKGDKGEKGDTGESGVVVPISGLFTLSGDAEGNLYVYYADGGTPPEFETDTDGNIYYITPNA